MAGGWAQAGGAGIRRDKRWFKTGGHDNLDGRLGAGHGGQFGY